MNWPARRCRVIYCTPDSDSHRLFAKVSNDELNICVMGAARTGTHLINSIICQTGETTPLLPEAHLLNDIAVLGGRIEKFAQQYHGSYFDSPEDSQRLAAAPLFELIRQMQEKFATRKCVFRGPELSQNAGSLYRLFANLDVPFRFV